MSLTLYHQLEALLLRIQADTEVDSDPMEAQLQDQMADLWYGLTDDERARLNQEQKNRVAKQ